jgi:putative membrane protein
MSQPFDLSGWDVAVFVSLAGVAAMYAVALVRIWRRVGVGRAVRWWEALAFWAGWAVLLVALSPYLHALSQTSFAAHMTQHELLMLVAAPLIVLGRPLVAALWLVPSAQQHHLQLFRQPLVSGAWRRLTAPVTVLIVHGLVVWLWHVPVLFEAALHSEAVHAFQHITFFWTAALFWWALVHGRYGRLGYGVGVIFVFLTAVHTSLLGALLTFAPRVWYPTYQHTGGMHGVTPLEDQQIAGLLMWVPSGAILMVCGLALFAAWLGHAARHAPSGVPRIP